jgi:hypothetical protein
MEGIQRRDSGFLASGGWPLCAACLLFEKLFGASCDDSWNMHVEK